MSATNKKLTPEQVRAAYRVFQQSEDGKTVLADLRESYYDRSSFNPNQPDPQVTAWREGQRSVVADILSVLEELEAK